MMAPDPLRPCVNSPGEHEMPRVFIALIGCLLSAFPFAAHSSEESCAVDGSTVRWALSYCMTRFETDDEAHPRVSACFRKELEQRQANDIEEDCEANLAYKSAICSILIEWKIYEESLASCVASKDMIPSVVKYGIG